LLLIMSHHGHIRFFLHDFHAQFPLLAHKSKIVYMKWQSFF
jgi:hypothetical protein